MWNGIWTQRQESETPAVTSVYKFTHVTCCAALSSRRDADILLHTNICTRTLHDMLLVHKATTGHCFKTDGVSSGRNKEQ